MGYPGTDLVPRYRRYPTRYPGTRVLVPALMLLVHKNETISIPKFIQDIRTV